MAATQLIALDPATKRLVVTDAARSHLASLSGTVGVCTVAGVYRTGKSYILNQLSGSEGFGVGSSVQACTKGIWLWSTAPRQAQPGGPDHLLLLDTEGLQSIAATEGHDAKIFCLAILLSSFFIYNADKAINSAALDQLSLVAQLTQRIRVHSGDEAGGSSSSLAAFFPRFVWLLRDFQLELTAADGVTPLSPTEYLEECLQPQPGKTPAVAEQNATRDALRSLFAERTCVALPHPTIGTSLPASALKKLPDLSKLAPGFRAGVTSLQQMVSTLRPKTMHGRALTGPMLLSLAESYVEAINDGALPTISTAWQSVLTLEATRALQEATTLYVSGAAAVLNAAKDEGTMPDESQWLAEHARLRDVATRHFDKVAVGGGGEGGSHHEQLVNTIELEKVRVDELLAARSATLCDRLAATLGERLESYAKRASSAPAGTFSHAEKLPPLLGELLQEYDTRAKGTGKGAGRTALVQRMIHAVRDALTLAEAAAATAQRDAASSSGRLETLVADLDGARRDLEASRRELATSREQAASAASAAQLQQREAAARTSESDARLRALTTERDASAQRAASLSADVDRLHAQLAAEQKNTSTLREQHSQLQVRLGTEAQVAQQGNASVREQLAARTAELDAARAESANAARSLAGKDAEISRLTAELQARASAPPLPPQPTPRERAASAPVPMPPPPSAAPIDEGATSGRASASNKRQRANTAAEAAPPPVAPACAPPAAAEAPAETLTPISSMTVAQLRAELESRGLPTDGKKAALVGRLEGGRSSRPASAAANISPPGASAAAASSFAPPPAHDGMSVDDDGSSEVAHVTEAAAASGAPADAPKKPRMSIDASKLALPVLQGKLRLVLGANAKLPKKKADLLALYMDTCEH